MCCSFILQEQLSGEPISGYDVIGLTVRGTRPSRTGDVDKACPLSTQLICSKRIRLDRPRFCALQLEEARARGVKEMFMSTKRSSVAPENEWFWFNVSDSVHSVSCTNLWSAFDCSNAKTSSSCPSSSSSAPSKSNLNHPPKSPCSGPSRVATLVIVRGNPGVFQGYPYPYPYKTVPLLRVGVLTGQG